MKTNKQPKFKIGDVGIYRDPINDFVSIIIIKNIVYNTNSKQLGKNYEGINDYYEFEHQMINCGNIGKRISGWEIIKYMDRFYEPIENDKDSEWLGILYA